VLANGLEGDARTLRFKEHDGQSETSGKPKCAQETRSTFNTTKFENRNETKLYEVNNNLKPEIKHSESMSKSDFAGIKSPTNLRLITELANDPNAPGEIS